MDSISNMLIIMKNGSLASKESVTFPYSKMKEAIAETLKKEGYVSSVAKKFKNNQKEFISGSKIFIALEMALGCWFFQRRKVFYPAKMPARNKSAVKHYSDFGNFNIQKIYEQNRQTRNINTDRSQSHPKCVFFW